MSNTYIQHLNWRYATKQFDPAKKIEPELFDTLLETMRLAPSSIGFQPWKFIVVTNPEIRQQLRAAAWGQPQITDAAALIVFAAKKTLKEADVDHVVDVTAAIRGITKETLADYRGMLMGSIQGKSDEELWQWNRRQVYIPLGFLLSACAQMEVDACPMEGFDTAKFDQILGLDKLGVASTAVCAVGYRSTEDRYAQFKKARFPKEEVFTFVK